MSANWYTYTFFFDDKQSAQNAQQLVKGKSDEDVLEALGLASQLDDSSDWVEGFYLGESYFKLELQSSTSSDIHNGLIRAGKPLGVEFVKAYIFFDQVGEEETMYFHRGKCVEGGRLTTLLDQFAPMEGLKKLIENNDQPSLLKALDKAKSNSIDIKYEHLLSCAKEAGSLPMFNLLLELGEGDTLNSKQRATVMASMLESEEIDALPFIRELIKRELDLDTCLEDGGSLLWHTWPMDKKVAQALADKGAAYIRPTDIYEEYDEEDEDDQGVEKLCVAILHNDEPIISEELAKLTKDSDDLDEVGEACCQADRVDYLKQLIALGYNPLDEEDDFEQVSQAASAGALDVLNYLFDGAKQKGHDLSDKYSDLLEGLAGNDQASSIIKQLLDAGGKLESNYGLTNALEMGAIDNAKLLIENGCPIEDEDDSILHQILSQLTAQTATMLLDAGADPLIKNEDELSVIHCALTDNAVKPEVKAVFEQQLILLDVEERVWLLLAMDNVALFTETWSQLDDKDMTNEQGEGLLSHGCRQKAIKIVAFLLEQKVGIGQKDTLGNTPLATAVMTGHSELVLQLLKAGADVNDKVCVADKEDNEDEDEDAAAVFAAVGLAGFNELVDVAEKVSEPEDIEGDSATVLMWAANYGDLAMVNLLLEHNADISAKDEDGTEVLFFCVANGHREIFDVLLAKGADINTKAGDGENLLQYAAFRGLGDFCRLLAGKGLDVNARGGTDNNTALTLVGLFGVLHDEDLVSILLELGADVDIRNGDDKSPLICACENVNVNATVQLLNNNANVDFVDCDAKTAYDYWLESASEDDEDIEGFDIEALKPKSTMIGLTKTLVTIKNFLLWSLLPWAIVIGIVSFIWEAGGRYLTYGVAAWWLFKLVRMIRKKLTPVETKPKSPLEKVGKVIVKAMEQAEEKEAKEKKVVESWDDDEPKPKG